MVRCFILDMKTKKLSALQSLARVHTQKKGQNKFDSGGAAVVLPVANQQKPSSPCENPRVGGYYLG